MSEQLGKLRQAQRQLGQLQGRAPTVEDLADFTGLKPLDIREILFRAQQPLSLDAASSPLGEDSLMERISCEAPRPDERLSRHLLSADFEQLLLELPNQEAELLRLRYGINGQEPMPLSEVARSLGVTRDITRGIERRAVTAIRDRSQKVIDYLEV